MKNLILLSALSLFLTQHLFSQEYKKDERLKTTKEDPFSLLNQDKVTTLDLLQMLETEGIRINKFQLGKFDKKYTIFLLADTFSNGSITKTDTLSAFNNTYFHFDKKTEKPFFDYLDEIKIISKDDSNKSQLFIKTYQFSSKSKIELNKTNDRAFYNWVTYPETKWKLDKKVPLMIYASSWTDKKYGIERFCGVPYLTEGTKDSDQLLSSSPSYVLISYKVIN